MSIQNKDALIELVDSGQPIDYLFFWGHRPPKSRVSKSCLSQWYEASFGSGGVNYPTAEHYMMAEKARLFDDDEVLKKILATASPATAKKLGRQVRGFDNEVWLQQRFDIVVAANVAKFSDNPALRRFLLETNNQILVEASPVDKIWGIGLAANHPDASSPRQWPGENLLELMIVRSKLAI